MFTVLHEEFVPPWPTPICVATWPTSCLAYKILIFYECKTSGRVGIWHTCGSYLTIFSGRRTIRVSILFNDKDTNTGHTGDFSLDRMKSLQATEKGESNSESMPAKQTVVFIVPAAPVKKGSKRGVA